MNQMYQPSGQQDLNRGVRCREIGEIDVEAVADLLTRGFAGRSRQYWLRGLHRQGARDVPKGYPRYGYILDNGGVPVGVLLLIYTARTEGGTATIRCNLSSWYVDPAFRNYAPLLTGVAQRNKEVTYVNISAAHFTWPIIEAQGFKRYCGGLFYSLPALTRGGAATRIEAVTPPTSEIEGLTASEFELLKRHAEYGCISLICHGADGPAPFVFMPLRIRRGWIAPPAVQLVYCRDVSEFVRHAGAIGRHLLRHGKVAVLLDANEPTTGLVGIYSEARGRKYFKGPNPPRLADLSETEFVLYGP